jgi:hypothetical protein
MRDVVRTGVCVVRAEHDPHAGLRLTVTVVPDVNRPPAVPEPHSSVSIDAVLDEVRAFLEHFATVGK